MAEKVRLKILLVDDERNVKKALLELALTDGKTVQLIKERLHAPLPVEFKTLREVEREHIERVLAAEGNQERAASILGITTVTLWRKRKQFGLP